LDARFDQGERLQGIARDEPLVAKLDKAVGDVGRVEPEILRVEAFATPPVTDGGGDQNSFAAHSVEERLV
jgi:hypothetical protein